MSMKDNWMVQLMANPFFLYSDYAFECQQEGKKPITFEEWKKIYFEEGENDD